MARETNQMSGTDLSISRRTALGLGIRGSLGAAICGYSAPLLSAMEPFVRSDWKFKFSLAAYSYRKLLQGNPPLLQLTDFIDDCARFGLDGTELTSYYFPPEPTTEYLYQLKQRCFQLGLDVSGTAVGNDFGRVAGEARDREIANVKRWVDRAQLLGAPVIRIFAGHVPAGDSPTAAHRRIVEGIEDCCQYAGSRGVHLALENHGGPTSTVDGLMGIVRDVQSPWFGVNLDTGNFQTEDVYGDLERVAPYALNVQVKVVVSGPDGKRGPADFSRLAQILKNANYRGYVVLEYEESGDPRAESARYLRELRVAFHS